MGQNKQVRFGPATLANAAANILNPGTTTGGVGAGTPQNTYHLMKHIRVVNRTAAAVAVSLFIGATGASAAGSEFLWSATPVPANSFLEAYMATPLEVADFLTGFAGAAASLTIEIDYEVGIR